MSSHPTRVRGLKQSCNWRQREWQLSHPTRVRGLKLLFWRLGYCLAIVAPHTGAWIETATILVAKAKKKVAPHTGAWIET